MTKELKLRVRGNVGKQLRVISAYYNVSIDETLAYVIASVVNDNIRREILSVIKNVENGSYNIETYTVRENYIYVRKLARLWRTSAQGVLSILLKAIRDENVRKHIIKDVKMILSNES